MKKLSLLLVLLVVGFSVFAEIKSFIYNKITEDETVYFAVYYDNEYDIEEMGVYYAESYVLELNFRPEIYTNGFTYVFDGFDEGDFESTFSTGDDDTDLDRDFLKICTNLVKRYGYFRMDVYDDPTKKYTMEYFRVGEDKIMERHWIGTDDEVNNKKKRR